MRQATILLAMIGSVWAFAGIGGGYLIIDSFRYIESGEDLLKSVFTLALLLSGYWIWFGWLRYSFKERFPRVSVRNFWLISLVHHAFCLLYLIPEDLWGGGDDPWWIPIWIIANIVIAAFFFAAPDNTKTAEQVAASDR